MDEPVAIDIETISLSSNEDEIKSIPKTPIKPTPKPRRKAPSRASTAFTPSCSAKKPLSFKNHKISDFFSSAKKTDRKSFRSHSTAVELTKSFLTFSAPSISNVKLQTPNAANNKVELPNETKTNETQSKVDKSKENEPTEAKKCQSDLRKVKNVMRRLSIEKAVETTRKRRIVEDQSKLPEFIDYESTKDGYFQTYEQSTYNEAKEAAPTELISDLPDLMKRLKSDVIDDVFEHDSRTRSDVIDEDTSKGSMNNVESTSSKSVSASENVETKVQPNTRSKKGTKVKKETKSKKGATKKSKQPSIRKRKKVECPHYKIVEDTKLAVDAFRYGDIEGVEHYFLSHFHADHYIGLKKSFNHKLYVSHITGK